MAFGGNMIPRTSTQTPAAVGPQKTRHGPWVWGWLSPWLWVAVQATQFSMVLVAAWLLNINVASGDSPDHGHPYDLLW